MSAKRNKIIKLSELFFKTLREDPSLAEVQSHKLLIRAGYIRQNAPGIFSWMPLGLMVLKKIESIIHEEMQVIGAQQVHFPALLPKEPYQKTNRWQEYGNNIFRLKDRRDNDYLLAPTHEEMFTLMVKDIFSSYKDLPVQLYQVQTKYRDEVRPRAGLLRGREFIMKDAYSFDMDDEGLRNSYQLYRNAYQQIFKRLNMPYVIVRAQSGAMGGSESEEFLCPTDIGEDTFVSSASGYAANVEAAQIKVPSGLTDDEIAKLPVSEVVETPGLKTIEEVSKFMQTQPKDMLKTVYLTLTYPHLDNEIPKKEVVVICLPGDRDLDIKRAEALFSPCDIEVADDSVLKAYPELVPGFVGPGAQFLAKEGEAPVRFFYDSLVTTGSSWVCGANKQDKHVKNLVAGRDFLNTDDELKNVISVVEVKDGDEAFDGSGKLTIQRGVEVGHIFALGKKYTQALELKVLDQNGKTQTPTMGSYGIGVTRILALLAELNHDEKGLAWPKSVAPADIHIVITSKSENAIYEAEKYAQFLAPLDVIIDDRKVSPGIKFKDAELLGVPQIAVFGRGLDEDEPYIELKDRDGSNLKKIPLKDIHI